MKILEEVKNNILKRKLKNERGSVTLFVLIAMLFFLTVGIIIFITNMNSSTSQQRDVKRIQSEYNNVGDLDKIYEEQKDKQVGRLVISVIDKYNEIYQSTTQNKDSIWINQDNVDRLPLTVDIEWPEGVDDSAKKVEISGILNKVSGEAETTHIVIKENEVIFDKDKVDFLDTLNGLAKIEKDCDITITATVNEGTNAEIRKSVNIRVDRTKPNLTYDNNLGDNASVEDGEDSIVVWVDKEDKENAKIEVENINVTDATSGVKNLKYIYSKNKYTTQQLQDLDISQWTDLDFENGTITKTVEQNGTNEQEYCIDYRAEDIAGNILYKKTKIYMVKFANYRIETPGQANQYAMTLAQAIGRCAETGSKIVALQDYNDDSYTNTDKNTVELAKNVTIDTNGKNITMTNTITVASGKTATFVDRKEEGSKGKLARKDGDLITNSGTVSLDGATLESNRWTIYGGTVNMTSGNINGIGEQEGDTAGIYNANVKMTGGTIQGARYGIIGRLTNGNGLIEISGGTVIGKDYGVCPGSNSASLKISSNTKIEGTNQCGIISWSVHKNNGTINITSGTVTGGRKGIYVEKDNTTTVNIGDEKATLSTETPVITGTTEYGIAILDANTTLNFYNGKIVGKQTTKVRGVDVAFSIADQNKAIYRVENKGKDNEVRYGVHTDEKDGMYETTLVVPEIELAPELHYLNLLEDGNPDKKSQVTIDVQGDKYIGTVEYESKNPGIATVARNESNDKQATVTAVKEGKTQIVVTDTNSGVTKLVDIVVDATAPTITASPSHIEHKKKVDVTLTAIDVDKGDATSGLADDNKYEYAVSDSNKEAPTTGWTKYTSGKPFTVGEGQTRTCYIWVKQIKDKAVNTSLTEGTKVNTYHVFGPYEIDNTPPKVIINGQATGVTDGLVKYYDGSNNLGNGHSNNTTTWKDLSKNQGTDQTNNVHNVTFSDEGYASFNGTSSWVSLGEYNPTNAVTVETEITLHSIQSGEADILGNWETGGCGLLLNEGRPSFLVYINGLYQEILLDEVLDINRNYHITGTYNGTTMKLYIDGVEHASKDISGNIGKPINNTVWAIGANPSGNIAGGSYADINIYSARVYSQALTETQIRQNMNADRIRPIELKTNDDKVTLSIIFNEDVKGLTADDFEVTNGTKGALSGSGNEYTLPITNIKASDTLTVTLKDKSYTDLAENAGPSYSVKRYRDIAGPTPTITADPSVSPTAANNITYTIKYNEPTTGFSIEDIQVTNGTKGTYTRVSSSEFKIVVTNDKTYEQTITIPANACYDISGNGSSSISKKVVIDHDGPTITATPDSSTYTKTKNVTIKVEDTGGSVLASDNVYEYALGENKTTAPTEGWTTYVSGTAFNIGNGITGTRYLWVRQTKDALGNISAKQGTKVGEYHVFGPYVFDNSGPKITFDPNGSTTYKKIQSTKVTVEDNGAAGVDADTLKYQWSQSDKTPDEKTFTEGFESGKTLSKQSVTGDNWYLWILAKDNLGNTTILKSEPFYIDNTIPKWTITVKEVN